LDVEMPRMDGLTFLRNLMRLRPMPVVMVSSLTAQGADVTLEALELGAIDFVTKPRVDLAHSLQDYTTEIIAKIKIASTARVRALERPVGQPFDVSPKYTADAILPQRQGGSHFKTTERIVALGASRGVAHRHGRRRRARSQRDACGRSFITNARPDWTIVEAGNAQEALEKTAALTVDAMTLDLNMPGMDGLSLAAQFKEKYPKARITILTANIQSSVRQRAEAASVSFMAKPITEDNVLAFISGVESVCD